MSPGACRALVASLLSLIAAGLAVAAPVTARTEDLDEVVLSRYEVDQGSGRIDVSIVLNLTNTGQEDAARVWGPLYLEDAVSELDLKFTGGARREGAFNDLPGPWKAMDIRLPKIAPGAERNVSVDYRIVAGDVLSNAPLRLGESYVYFCMTGQEADRGQVKAGLPRRYETTISGSPMEEEAAGLTTSQVAEPGELFMCVEGTVEKNLAELTFVGPADREFVLQARPEDDQWLTPARENALPALDRLTLFLGQDVPGDGPVVIRQTPPASLGGYASDHAAPRVVQLDEFAGVIGIDHQMAHAWFGATTFPEQWMREGLAEWAAKGATEGSCPAVTDSDPSLDLSDWQVVRPTAPDDVDTVIEQQEAAACGIVSRFASLMGGDEAFKAVAASMLNAEEKYTGSGSPGQAASDIVDWMEFLDAVDERGLVPATGTGELDLAQELLARYAIPDDPAILEQRSATRRRYHDFLARATPLAAPVVVRRAMEDWRFEDANEALDRADAVLADLTSADALLPEAGLVPFIQPGFESAESLAALESVREEAASLLTAAELIIPPLGELRESAPAEWNLPAAVRSAVIEKRFEDALAAVSPAVTVAQAIVAADLALPEAGLRKRYQAQFEAAATTTALEQLAETATEVREQAEATGMELDALESSVGDWVIPPAVMRPIRDGQIEAALTIARDARGVVAAARQADLALPEADLAKDFRPRFEAVRSGSEMAALRKDAEAARDTAQTVGNALSRLKATVPSWTFPAIITTPIEERDFDTAATVLTAAAAWVTFADQADDALEEMGALARTREGFEGATSVEELVTGADVAEDWATAAGRVGDAISVADGPRDLMTDIGLFGIDLAPLKVAAIEAAQGGDVAEATTRAALLSTTFTEGARSGGLRLAGIAFLVVALIGVVGLWWLFRRDQGPPWARKRPPWARRGTPPWAKK